ncbi:MAG TPA: TonB-dependent receptor [Woeseiaceae bacterium]|nr:TonB-dependent receptor [Woeseiaceae bacterium]
MNNFKKSVKQPLPLMILTVLASWQGVALGQEEPVIPAPVIEEQDAGKGIEEVVVTGRFISSSQQLMNERMNDAFATDLLGADTISRLGDSTVAAALRRVPGLSLVQDKFIYIRGLGERYSSTTLNGAQIPSPDLTRNVIPLNVFPTSIVESLRVQKSYSPAISANFGGGAVDIRTKGIPDAFTVKLEGGIGYNDINPSSINTYPGGGDDNLGSDDGTRALSSVISAGLADYQGDPGVNNIRAALVRSGSDLGPGQLTFESQRLNRDLALALNRNIGLQSESVDPNYEMRASVGNNFELGNDWEAGFAVGGSYEQETSWRRTRTANFALPEEQNGVREESTKSVNIAGTLNFGVNFLGDHEISTTSLFLRNTDDETEVFDYFNENRFKSSGRGVREYRLEFEEREMETHQVRGTHFLGADTRSRFGIIDSLAGFLRLPEETRITWFYSDSEATTDIPNRVQVNSFTSTDRDTGAVLAEAVQLSSAAGDWRFTELEDLVENYGWSGMIPLEFGNNYVELSGGWDHAQKARTYKQTQFSLGFLNVQDQSVLEGPLNEVFSDANILATAPDPNPANPVPGAEVFVNDAVFDRQGANTNSYLAATMTDSVWGQVDWDLSDSWRFAAGARWEDYRQAGLPWNPFSYSQQTPQVTTDPDELASAVFRKDDVYPAASITYMSDFLAETFQLRLGYSETAVRPDLREITGSSYIDPITDDLTRGNSSVVPSEVENIDLRAEWFFGNGDTFTVTLFDKQITNPIEFFEIPASDTTIAREILNADSASIQGVEVEFLTELGFLGSFADMFFVQGNVTYQWDRELTPGDSGGDVSCERRDSSGAVVANDCKLSGASEYVVNFMLGFDSPDSRHTASLIYNVFSERLFAFGRFGPDAFEQPFDSLDFTYFWYPTDRFTLKLKAQNILDSSVEIQRTDASLGRTVTVFEEKPGRLISASLAWGF